MQETQQTSQPNGVESALWCDRTWRLKCEPRPAPFSVVRTQRWLSCLPSLRSVGCPKPCPFLPTICWLFVSTVPPDLPASLSGTAAGTRVLKLCLRQRPLSAFFLSLRWPWTQLFLGATSPPFFNGKPGPPGVEVRISTPSRKRRYYVFPTGCSAAIVPSPAGLAATRRSILIPSRLPRVEAVSRGHWQLQETVIDGAAINPSFRRLFRVTFRCELPRRLTDTWGSPLPALPIDT